MTQSEPSPATPRRQPLASALRILTGLACTILGLFPGFVLAQLAAGWADFTLGRWAVVPALLLGLLLPIVVFSWLGLRVAEGIVRALRAKS
jgi:hypothetical protein